LLIPSISAAGNTSGNIRVKLFSADSYLI